MLGKNDLRDAVINEYKIIQQLVTKLPEGSEQRRRYDYFRDGTIALEAFKAGEYDFRSESTSKLWATGYDSPALRNQLVIKEEIRHERPTGMQGFLFNTRRELFKAEFLVIEALDGLKEKLAGRDRNVGKLKAHRR